MDSLSTTDITSSVDITTLIGYTNFLITASSGITITLPTTAVDGYNIIFERKDNTSNLVTIIPQISQTLNNIVNGTFLIYPQAMVRPFIYTNRWNIMSTTYPPFATDMIVTIRPNQPIQMNLITGIAYNPGFGPTLNSGASGFTGSMGASATNGGALTNPGLTIVNATIYKNPPNSAVFGPSGVSGNFAYTPLSRYTGTGFFNYKVTDSSGIESKNTGTAMINVVCRAPGGTGPRFIYGTTGSPGQVIEYNNGPTSLLFTPTRGDLTVNNLATNRDDGLIYYSQNAGSTTSIFAYDYIGNTQFILTNGSVPPFPLSINKTGGAACYNQGVLYMTGATFTTGFMKIYLDKYTAGSASQTITSVSFIPWSDGLARDFGGMCYDFTSNTLITLAIQSGITNSRISVVNPTNGNVLSVVTLASASYSHVVINPDGVIYVTNGGVAGNTVSAINPQSGVLQFPNALYFTATGPSDVTDWICQAVAL